MLYTIVAILFVLWLLGFTMHVGGGAFHAFLVIAAERCFFTASKSRLSHVNLGTPLFKMDFIHQLIDEENTTALSCVNVLTHCGICNTSWIEALTRIAREDKHPPRLVTSDTDLYLLAGVLFASVHNSVRQGLA